MEILRKLAVSALIGFGAFVSTANSADAATTIGATALEAHAWGAQDCYGRTLYIQAASTGVSYVVPRGGGVITSWSAHGFGAPAALVLKIVRNRTADTYLVRGSSVTRTVAASGSSTFPARLSVAAGDEIALWVPSEYPDKAPCNYVTENAGDVQAYVAGSHPEPAVGDEYGPTDNGGPGFRLNVSAKVEPDADRDGYGDETQDGCPTDAAVQKPCPDRAAPRTTITKAPKPKIKTTKKRAKVKLAFTSSEPSKFSCTLDRVTRPCSSPFKATVRKGRHHFSVAATDRAGNTDVTPARVKFAITPRRPAERSNSVAPGRYPQQGQLQKQRVSLAQASGGNSRYRGRSGQGKKVLLVTDRAGKLKRFAIRFRAECGRGHLDNGLQRFVRPLRHVDSDGFRDAGTYRIKLDRGGVGKIRTRLEGERVAPNKFEGTFSFRGRYFTHGGEKITSCRTALIHWSAHR